MIVTPVGEINISLELMRKMKGELLVSFCSAGSDSYRNVILRQPAVTRNK